MALTSNVPKITFTQTGVVIPAESDVLAGVQSDINAAFGGGLNPALETPQGQLASSQSAAIGYKNGEFAYFVNQVDPQYSSGKFQDGIGRIYFLNRKPATSTSVMCTLTGSIGAVIPAGSFAQDTNGNTYAATGDITIGLAGTANGEFQNVKTGPIPCASGTLTKVYQAVAGWDAITNSSAGVTGQDVESRADFEYRRKQSVALNGKGTAASIYGAVFDVDNVTDVYVTENPTSSTVTVGSTSYSMLPHSLYVGVVGGVDSDIAKAIWNKKDIGCDYNGNTTVTVTDDSGYNYPYPSYTVKFHRPDSLPIKFAVQIVNSPSLPTNIVALVKAAIVARFNGADGSSRERMGSLVLASRYYGPIAGISSSVSLLSVLIGTSTATLTQIQVGIDKAPTISESDITVTLV